MRAAALHRRVLLKAAGASLPLPLLPSLTHSLFGGEVARQMAAPPKRFLCVHFTYGVVPEDWWPEADKDWRSTPTLRPLGEHADDVTLLKGVSLLRGSTAGTHGQPYQFLNANRTSLASADQLIAAQPEFGHATRYPSIQAGGESLPEGVAFTPEGVPLPAVSDAAQLYQQLFGEDGTDPRVALERLKRRRSMLDALLEDTKDVGRRLDATDRRKLDEYLTSVRQLETKIGHSQRWIQSPRPKPVIDQPDQTPPVEEYQDLADVFLDLLLAAFQTDQTRVASFFFSNSRIPTSDGGVGSYHSFTHHNGDQDKIRQLAYADRARNRAFAALLAKMKAKTESDGSSLLDNTLVLYGSATENASRHQGVSLPLVLAGRPDLLKHGRRHKETAGGMVEYRYGKHGISDLLLTLMQAQGVERDTFAEGDSVMSELLV